MHTLLKFASGAVLALLLGSPALACYTVYNRANQVVYHAAAAPVNMSYQLHETLPAFYPGGHLVFSITDNDCPQVNTTRVNTGGVAYVAGSGETVMQSPGSRPYRVPRN
ncbi:MAG: hypothetical protein Q8M51_03210 [Polaromonas sp.]|uniref:hypothetical protein n=1 Tax=Polaromonas sp. TaxID=1869339 RepID=UPI002731F3E1|nr:hypothetical protein [Polaromonas sp.]MDP1742621.1 hypothetical protein [Polaromonas sp.]MDP1955611.1 hypothetical protein [Polaromonas sp.]MDP3354861.1 hypothetical protein [Polaromonas sp.]MDP3752497.1 hypothetical protein [Polaromonas sp.]